MRPVLFLITILLFSCAGKQDKVAFPFEKSEYSPPDKIKADHSNQHKASLQPVDTDTLPLPKKKKAGIPNIIKVNPAKALAGEAITIPAGTPERAVATGKKVAAQGKRIPARQPESFLLLKPDVKDEATHNLKFISQDQRLPGTVVNDILQDRFDRLWVGTDNGLALLEGDQIKVYTVNEGLSDNYIFCLLEDREGHLWVGTYGGGVNRYDGKSFVQYTTEGGLSDNSVFSLLEDRTGKIWIGTYRGGLNVFDGHNFTHYNSKRGMNHDHISSLTEDSKGRIWIGTSGGGVNCFDGKSFTYYTTKEGLNSNNIFCLLEDSKGNIWIGGDAGGVKIFDGQNFTSYTSSQGLSQDNIYSLMEDHEGRIWIGTVGGGVNVFDGTNFTYYASREGLSNNTVNSLLEDRLGDIWIGTDGGGLNIYDRENFTHYTAENLGKGSVNCLMEDKLGRLWVGTYGDGINIFDGKNFTRYSILQGLNNNYIYCLMEDKSGQIWIGTGEGGLNVFDGESFTHITDKEGLVDNHIFCLLEDAMGKIWIGTNGGGASVYNEGRFAQFTTAEGLSNNTVHCLLQDQKGRIWMGTNGGGVSVYNGENFTHYTTEEGLSHNTVFALLEDLDGNIWIGTSGGGLNIFDGLTFTQYSAEEGLADNSVLQLAMDSLGRVWAGTGKGMTRFAAESNGEYTLTTWQKLHGLKYMDFNAPGVAMLFSEYNKTGPKGTLWAGIGSVLTQYVASDSDTSKPLIYLTGLDIDGQQLNWNLTLPDKESDNPDLPDSNGFLPEQRESAETKRLRKAGIQWEGNDDIFPYHLPKNLSVPYAKNHLTFHFSGLKFRDWVDIRYRYILEGLDEEWSPITPEGKTEYRHIPPGTYTFRVRARSRNKAWSQEKSVSVTIRPPWWRIWWAIAGYFILSILLVTAYVRWRMAALKEREKELQKIVEERTQEIREQRDLIEREKEKSDNLLLNILPAETARELRQSGSAKAQYYDLVTVMFTDFENFTQASEQLSPQKLVAEINYCFSEFDKITTKYGIEKIKTIGDAYMCAGGLPIADKDHVEKVVLAALEIQEFMENLKKEREAIGETCFGLRIGIHSGPVVAGVVGIKKFAYDIWGDTVNTASRVESGGVVGKVNLSETTYQLIRTKFKCTYRGKLPVKNKGEIEMYFVEKKKL